MNRQWQSRAIHLLIPLAIALAPAADLTWKDKPVAEWTAAEAGQALADSPWVKSVSSKFIQPGPHAVVVQPVTPMGRVYGPPRIAAVERPAPSGSPPTLTLRWESALPMRGAQLKSGNVNAPAVDEDHYAIAVYGLPDRLLGDDPATFAARLKPEGSLKREKKKTISASDVKLLPRDNGSVVVFYFPKREEISNRDKEIEFSGRVGWVEFAQSFSLGDMIFGGKLEL
jgi:hypothetical protein